MAQIMDSAHPARTGGKALGIGSQLHLRCFRCCNRRSGGPAVSERARAFGESLQHPTESFEEHDSRASCTESCSFDDWVICHQRAILGRDDGWSLSHCFSHYPSPSTTIASH